MQKRAQVAIEYMMVVGFALLMVIPLVAIYGVQGQAAKDDVNEKQAFNIARKLVDAAETVYYLGEPSKTTLKVYMPNNIDSISITDHSIDFIIKTTKGPSQIAAESPTINMTGTLSTSPGIRYIEVLATGDAVNISTIK